jgi:hypothetical protein
MGINRNRPQPRLKVQPDRNALRANPEELAAGISKHVGKSGWITEEDMWLLGQDSNLEPSGYKRPKISSGLGLSLHPLQEAEGRVSGASPDPGSGYELAL